MCYFSGSMFLSIQSTSDIRALKSFLGETCNSVFIDLTVSSEWEDWKEGIQVLRNESGQTVKGLLC